MTWWPGPVRRWVDSCRDGVAPYAELVEGETYVCEVGEDTLRLVELVFDSMDAWVEPGSMTGEGGAYSHCHAQLTDAAGRPWSVPRPRVLWTAADHAAVVAATASLGLPLVPRGRRPVPTWVLGSLRLPVPSLVALGRLLGGDRR